MSDKPGDSPDKNKPKDDDNRQTRLPPVTPSTSGSETSPEASRNVDELRNREDLIGWFDDDEETIAEVPRQKRRTVKPNLARRRITKPGTDIKKEIEELAGEMHGRWQEEPSPLKLAEEKKLEHHRITKRIVPFKEKSSISPSTPRGYSTSSSASPSPSLTARHGPLFDSFFSLPEISIQMSGDSSVTIRNALIFCIVLFCFSLIILAIAIYSLKFS